MLEVIDFQFFLQTLGIGNANFIQPSFDHHRLLGIGSYAIEERKQKLSRYRKKKSKRNFGRKIKVMIVIKFFCFGSKTTFENEFG